MEFVVWMGLSTWNLAIPHMGTPAVHRGVHKLRLERGLGIAEVRKDRPCQGLSRLARTDWSDWHCGANRLVRPREWKCRSNCLGCRWILWDKTWSPIVHTTKLVGRIFGMHMLLSPELWILGETLFSPDTGCTRSRCKRNLRNWISWPSPARILLCLTWGLPRPTRWQVKTYGITFKMFWVSVDHAPPERSRLPADKQCIDSNPGEKKDPLGSSKIG